MNFRLISCLRVGKILFFYFFFFLSVKVRKWFILSCFDDFFERCLGGYYFFWLRGMKIVFYKFYFIYLFLSIQGRKWIMISYFDDYLDRLIERLKENRCGKKIAYIFRKFYFICFFLFYFQVRNIFPYFFTFLMFK